jgi:hypothetical protein
VFFEALNYPEFRADVGRLDAIRREVDYMSVRLRDDRAIIWSRVDHDSENENQALWPNERLDQLERVCAQIGCRLIRH